MFNTLLQWATETLTRDLPDGASSSGFIGYKGHNLVGGLSARLFNAVTDQAVDALVDYLNLYAEQPA